MKKCFVRGGSPPHMRGKDGEDYNDVADAGITPAHAGKSTHLPHLMKSTRDHPRTCGEKMYNFINNNNNKGSPPHMRGKVIPICQKMGIKRITPAHAGKREEYQLLKALLKDHPRTCGEKYSFLL